MPSTLSFSGGELPSTRVASTSLWSLLTTRTLPPTPASTGSVSSTVPRAGTRGSCTTGQPSTSAPRRRRSATLQMKVSSGCTCGRGRRREAVPPRQVLEGLAGQADERSPGGPAAALRRTPQPREEHWQAEGRPRRGTRGTPRPRRGRACAQGPRTGVREYADGLYGSAAGRGARGRVRFRRRLLVPLDHGDVGDSDDRSPRLRAARARRQGGCDWRGGERRRDRTPLRP